MIVVQDIGILVPHSAGRVVGLCQFGGKIIVATEYGCFYELVDDGFDNYSLRQRMVERINYLENNATELNQQGSGATLAGRIAAGLRRVLRLQ